MSQGVEQREYLFWVVVCPAEDLPGKWTAHCLDLDLVTQGDTAEHAFSMAREAAEITVLDDLNSEREPRDRRAPEEFWERLGKMLQNSVSVTLKEVQKRGKMAAGQIKISVLRAAPVVESDLAAYIFSSPREEMACA